MFALALLSLLPSGCSSSPLAIAGDATGAQRSADDASTLACVLAAKTKLNDGDNVCLTSQLAFEAKVRSEVSKREMGTPLRQAALGAERDKLVIKYKSLRKVLRKGLPGNAAIIKYRMRNVHKTMANGSIGIKSRA